MEIDQHRTLAGQSGCPDVQLEHALAHVAVVPILEERLLNGGVVVKALRTVGTVDKRRVLARPRFGRFSRKPPVFPARVLTIRDALERNDAALHKPAYLSIQCLRDRRARRRTAARSLVCSGLNAVGSVSARRERSAETCGRGG